MILSQTEMKIVLLATIVFASITYKLVDQVIGMVPLVGTLFPEIADPNGCPSTIGFVVHVVVFAAAIKFILPRM